MSARGFLPFTTVGFLLLILTVAMLGHFSWGRHQAELTRIDEGAGNSLLGEVASVQNDLEQAARYSVYEALWNVSKRASDYSGREAAQNRKEAIESLASRNFNELLSSIVLTRENLGTSARLDIEQALASLDLRRGEGGFVIAIVDLPDETNIGASTLDNSLGLELPYENFGTLVDSRYYLLENRMQRFAGDLDSIGTKWKYAEYAMAYAGAWGGSGVTLSKSRSRALFQLAWADHELSTFGSSDYSVTAYDLSGIEGADQVLEGYDSNVVAEPLSASQVRALVDEIEASLNELDGVAGELRRASSAVNAAANFDVEDWADLMSSRFGDVQAALDASDAEGAKQKFRELCGNFELTYSYPSGQLGKASTSIGGGQLRVQEAEARFQQMLDLLESSASGNPLMKQFYENLTGDGQALARQISSGVSDVVGRLEGLESRVHAREVQLRAPAELSSTFPGDWEERFVGAVNDNLARAGGVLGEARGRAGEAIDSFMEFVNGNENLLASLYSRVSSEVRALLEEPELNWSNPYEEYPDPGEDAEVPPVTQMAEKYVIEEGEGTVGGLQLVLSDVKTHLDRMEGLAGTFESIRGEVTELEIDDDLRQALESELRFPTELTREQAYELAPPEPIESNPGISVYHEFEIKDVRYQREDPAGWFGSPTPTTIPLWFIGITIYWAQWDVTLEFEDGAVEEIFDYENPTLPRPGVDDDNQNLAMVHKPLAYRYEIPRNEFNFRLVVISLTGFEINEGE